MCIIVAVPANVPLPDRNTLRECFLRNPDGSGFMYSNGKSVKIRKGFMSFDKFMEALDFEDIPEDTAVVMHFRIKTHGNVQPKCCHPFPISSNPDDLKALSIDARWGVAHNGIIDGRSTSADWSDTMDFVAGVMAPLSRMNPSFMHSEDAQELLESACGSKLAILDNAGDLMLVGKFFEEDGVFYSNTSYIPYTYNYSTYSSWWDKQFQDKYDEKDEWGCLMAEEPTYTACELCPLLDDCLKYGEECKSDLESVIMCAEYSGMGAWEVAECVGFDTTELMEAIVGKEDVVA